MKKGIRNSIIFTLSAAMLAVPATANATEVTRNEPPSQLSSATTSYDSATAELRNKAGFTEEELSQLTPLEITELDSQLNIHQQSSTPVESVHQLSAKLSYVSGNPYRQVFGIKSSNTPL